MVDLDLTWADKKELIEWALLCWAWAWASCHVIDQRAKLTIRGWRLK